MKTSVATFVSTTSSSHATAARETAPVRLLWCSESMCDLLSHVAAECSVTSPPLLIYHPVIIHLGGRKIDSIKNCCTTKRMKHFSLGERLRCEALQLTLIVPPWSCTPNKSCSDRACFTHSFGRPHELLKSFEHMHPQPSSRPPFEEHLLVSLI